MFPAFLRLSLTEFLASPWLRPVIFIPSIFPGLSKAFADANANRASLATEHACNEIVIIMEPMPATQGVVVSFVAAAILTLSACVRGNSPSAPPATSASPASAPATERLVGPLTEAEAGALSTMNDRVKDYVKLHIKIERSLPKLPKDATPEEIDKNQRALQKKIQEARAAEARRYLHVPGASSHQTPARQCLWRTRTESS